eukprot:GHVP01037928.1.p1 GENE.GHVP01037928.1~~GHVP01037928.1.p1  ORF type:complete len:344 (+),score=57.69 GHVP01037928.1:726-1757(+)
MELKNQLNKHFTCDRGIALSAAFAEEREFQMADYPQFNGLVDVRFHNIEKKALVKVGGFQFHVENATVDDRKCWIFKLICKEDEDVEVAEVYNFHQLLKRKKKEIIEIQNKFVNQAFWEMIDKLGPSRVSRVKIVDNPSTVTECQDFLCNKTPFFFKVSGDFCEVWLPDLSFRTCWVPNQSEDFVPTCRFGAQSLETYFGTDKTELQKNTLKDINQQINVAGEALAKFMMNDQRFMEFKEQLNNQFQCNCDIELSSLFVEENFDYSGFDAASIGSSDCIRFHRDKKALVSVDNFHFLVERSSQSFWRFKLFNPKHEHAVKGDLFELVEKLYYLDLTYNLKAAE